MTRSLLIVLVLAASAASLQSQQSQQSQGPQGAPQILNEPGLIRWWPISEEIQAITLIDDKHQLRVDIAGWWAREWKGEKAKRPSAEGLQIWILRKDGTAIRRTGPLSEGIWSGGGGVATYSWEARFEPARFQDLAGVVVSEGHRRLHVREMPPKLARGYTP